MAVHATMLVLIELVSLFPLPVRFPLSVSTGYTPG